MKEEFQPDIAIEQVRPELIWRMRRDVLYPGKAITDMQMDEDANGIHFAAFQGNALVAVVSLFQDGDDYQFRKFAVAPDHQRQGIGSLLLNYITGFTRQQAGSRIWCNARLTAVDFYLKHGFKHTRNFFNRNGFDYEIIEKPLV